LSISAGERTEYPSSTAASYNSIARVGLFQGVRDMLCGHASGMRAMSFSASRTGQQRAVCVGEHFIVSGNIRVLAGEAFEVADDLSLTLFDAICDPLLGGRLLGNGGDGFDKRLSSFILVAQLDFLNGRPKVKRGWALFRRLEDMPLILHRVGWRFRRGLPEAFVLLTNLLQPHVGGEVLLGERDERWLGKQRGVFRR